MSARMVRKVDPGHIEEVANGIQAMGFAVPVSVGKGNVSIDGATGATASEELGLAEVPCVVVMLIPEEAAPRFLDDAAPRNGMMSPPDSEMIAPPIAE